MQATWQPRIVEPDEPRSLGLGVPYERQLAARLSESPRLWEQLGEALRPEWIQDTSARHVLTACHQVWKGTQEGPSSIATVSRQLRHMSVEQGRLSKEQLALALDLLSDHEPEQCPSDPEFSHQVGRAIRDRLKGEQFDKMIMARGKDPDLDTTPYTEQLRRIELIGKQRSTEQPHYDVTGGDVWTQIDKLHRHDKMPLGIRELDEELEGGIYRQSLVVYGADSNVGKSHALLHTSLHNVMLGRRVIYIPTEQSVPANMARTAAWVTNLPGQQVIAKTPEAVKRWAQWQSRVTGAFDMAFLPKGGTPSQLRTLLGRICKENPRFQQGWDILVVDIADRMGSDNKSSQGSYAIMGDVYEELADMAVGANGWVITGSQLKDMSNKKHKGPPGWQDLADSRHKGKIASAVITAWVDEDWQDGRWWHISKARDQKVGGTVGPLPTAFERNQIYPVPDAWAARPG